MGDSEFSLTSKHAIAVAKLPLLHKDPFDRVLLAQALVEDTPLATVDSQLLAYEAPVHYVG